MECQNKRFWRCLSSVGPFVALVNSPNALEMGSFVTKNVTKMGQKCVFLKMILGHLGCSRVTKCLEKGLFWDERKVKNGSKMCLSKDTFGLFGVHKQVE